MGRTDMRNIVHYLFTSEKQLCFEVMKTIVNDIMAEHFLDCNDNESKPNDDEVRMKESNTARTLKISADSLIYPEMFQVVFNKRSSSR